MRVRVLGIGLQPAFQDDKSLSGKGSGPRVGFGRVPAVLRKPPHRLGTLRLGAVSVRGLPPALGPADFNYSLLG